MDTDLSRKYIALEHNIRKLFIVCENIRNKISSVKIINSNNVVYASFSKFVKIYDEIGAEESMIIFEEFYKKKRIQILCKKDNWIRDKAILEYPSVKKVKTKGMILLSIFYNNALEIAKEAERDVVEFGRESEAANVYLPEEMIYLLIEIFLLVCPNDDVEILQGYKQEVLSELPSTNITPTVPPMLGNMGGLLGGLLGNLDLTVIQDSMKDMMKNGNSEQPDIVETMSKLFNNPKSKEIVENVTTKISGVKGADGLQEVLSGLLTDKKLIDDIKEVTGNLMPKVPEPIVDTEVEAMIENSTKTEGGGVEE